MKPGRYSDMPAEDYHSAKAINRGQVVQFDKSAAEWAAGKEHMDSDALRFGRAVHEAVLEPDIYAPRVVDVKGTRTKAFKEACQEHPDRIVLTEDEYDQVAHMARAVRNHDGAAALLDGGEAEVSYFWQDPATGLTCKCRLDYAGRGYAVDLKTTGKRVDSFSSAVFNYAYDVQAAFYLDGANEHEPMPMEVFYFIVVEKPPRYGDVARWKRVLSLGGGVRLFAMTPETVQQGRDIYKRCLRGIKHFTDNPVDHYGTTHVHELHCIRRF